MNNEINKIFNLSKFFTSKAYNNRNILCASLQKPSKILMHNINYKWLEFIYSKTNQLYPVFIENNDSQRLKSSTYGLIKNHTHDLTEDISIEYDNTQCQILNELMLHLYLVFPQQDIMQHFIKWQRYRKYWWSSITTTPSLFSISDMKSVDDIVDVNIVANYSWGQHIVENITLQYANKSLNNVPCLEFQSGLKNALLSIMVESQTNASEEGYLRIHNKIAPYSISFALDSEDLNIINSLKSLAKLLCYKLRLKNISTWLPDFKIPLKYQINENLQMGVTYTAILKESTLTNGIFFLLYSSTMLKEQIHIADFEAYAESLCKKNHVEHKIKK